MCRKKEGKINGSASGGINSQHIFCANLVNSQPVKINWKVLLEGYFRFFVWRPAACLCVSARRQAHDPALAFYIETPHPASIAPDA
jgi:hypothetical protein